MCPTARIGGIDVLLGAHHGQDTSNSEVLVHGVRPRVVIMNDGPRKGGGPAVMKTFYTSPGLEDLWQVHFSVLNGQEYTVPGLFIANTVDDQPADANRAHDAAGRQHCAPATVHNGPAYWIKVSAQEDGTFTGTNARNGFSKAYRARPR